jgi:hypothetical protein
VGALVAGDAGWLLVVSVTATVSAIGIVTLPIRLEKSLVTDISLLSG